MTTIVPYGQAPLSCQLEQVPLSSWGLLVVQTHSLPMAEFGTPMRLVNLAIMNSDSIAINVLANSAVESLVYDPGR